MVVALHASWGRDKYRVRKSPTVCGHHDDARRESSHMRIELGLIVVVEKDIISKLFGLYLLVGHVRH